MKSLKFLVRGANKRSGYMKNRGQKKFCRPVFVFKKLTNTTFLGIPVTAREKSGSWYVEFTLGDRRRWVQLNQIRVFDTRRLLDRIGSIADKDVLKIKKQFLNFYGS